MNKALLAAILLSFSITASGQDEANFILGLGAEECSSIIAQDSSSEFTELGEISRATYSKHCVGLLAFEVYIG